MAESDEPAVVVARLMQDLRNETWPPGLNAGERAGVDLVVLDADLAGCVTTWLGNGGSLDERRLAILRRRAADLDRVLPQLTEADNPRLWHLWHRMTRIISTPAPNPPTETPQGSAARVRRPPGGGG